jgi:fumarate hydratase class II
MTMTRTETDSFGAIEVPRSALWGAQTARSLRYFAIGDHRMPPQVIHALAWVKWAAAGVNRDLGRLDAAKAGAIAAAALRVAAGEYDDQFPLSVWQTGSGTQSHMNVNEVIARIASQALPDAVHPNDDVNLGQSTNDVFSSAMHIAVALQARQRLLPALALLRGAFDAKAAEFSDLIKTGRTHLQDATPVTLGQEFSGYGAQLALCEATLRNTLGPLYALAIGGTAVGTGLNTHPEFGRRVAAALAQQLVLPLVQAPNLFAAMAGHEALVAFHAGLRLLAVALTKIGNDIRLMGSGPRAGLGELLLPANEPGSSIMPGKVNPTQIEALTMICAQVMGHDVAVGFAASQGHFELNAYKPLIIYNALDSLRLLADAMDSFARHCVAGLRADAAHLAQTLQRSLMLVTALAPHIGYDRAAAIAEHAHASGIDLREAALAVGGVSGADFDAWVDARQMLAPRLD